MRDRVFKGIGLASLLLALAGCGDSGSGSGSGSGSVDRDAAAAGYSISGIISIPAGTAIDSDVNDPAAANRRNDLPEQAQLLSDPRIIGGFVTASPTGGSDDFFRRSADPRDVFRFRLEPGQRLTLEVAAQLAAPSDEVDLGLYLYPAGDHSAPLAYSRSLAALESLTVPATASPGPFDIVVEAFSGASNYVLEVGPVAAGFTVATAGGGDDFVPGELIVRFRDDDEVALAPRRFGARDRIAELGLSHRRGGPGQAQLLGLGEAAQRAEALQRLGVRLPATLLQSLNLLEERERARQETLLAVQALRRRDDVVYADLNYIRRPAAAPDDPYYAYQWHYRQIGLPAAWEVTTGSPEVIVAVVDTGVYMAHPDLQPNLLDTGYDFVRSVRSANDGDGIDPNPDDPGDSTTPGESSFHGTHVAGTIAAAAGNGIGGVGVAWNSRLMPIRVCGLDGCSSYDVMQGVRYAAGMSNDSGTVPPQPAAVINVSLGGAGASQAERHLFEQVRARGITVVAAAGNSASSAPSYPAAYPSVISVGAVDARARRAPYSNFGPTLDLVAPGGDTRRDDTGDGYPDGVLSTLASDRSGSRRPIYGFYQGTSMAAPHVAGVIALMKAVHPELTPAQFDEWLHEGRLTDDLGTPGRNDDFGWGQINAHRAVRQARAAAQSAATPRRLAVSPALLDFGSHGERLTLRIERGADAAPVQAVSASAAWLRVTPAADLQADGSGSYLIEATRGELGAGSHSADIEIHSEDGVERVPVLLQRDGAAGYAGVHHVLLVDADSGRTVAEVTAEFLGTAYQYRFDGVPAGRYRVYAGTDSNNDRRICDAGEACGAYPRLGAVATVELDGDRQGIDFDSGFRLQSERSATSVAAPARGVPRL